ncbi:MAG: saccharopine dehydrogenase NADP-binding domain-containing protein [Myxococcales bacterium]|nr:saccharopine dehydrogenase NADP-binding domain-containing protein [Myxococcales bacterium]
MRLAVLGAGRMGRAAAWDMARQEGVELVRLVDRDLAQLEQGALELHELAKHPELPSYHTRVETRQVDLDDTTTYGALFEGIDAVLSSADYRFNRGLTKAAIEAGVHLCDLGGNLFVVRDQLACSAEAEARGVTVVPDCGLAPGMACMLAAHGVEQLERVDEVRIRVGGLPKNPKPPLHYKLVFSVRGLTNEYLEPAEVVRDGVTQMVPSLTEIESLEFPPPFGLLEAFHTSGGISTLPQTLVARVPNMDYKTIRYPGHGAVFHAMDSLGFFSEELVNGVNPRSFTEAMLERALDDSDTDVVLVRVTLKGMREGAPATLTFEVIDEHDPRTGHSAMARTTAYPAAAVAYMMASGAIAKRGVLPGEVALPLGAYVDAIRARGIAIDERWS